MKQPWSAILLSLALAACGSPTSWSEELVIESSPAQATADAATVEGATGGLVVSGVYQAPGTGYTLRAYYNVLGDEVTLNVGGYGLGAGATRGAATGQGYRISIPVSAGTYRVRVTHHDQDGGDANSRQVASAEVVVRRN